MAFADWAYSVAQAAGYSGNEAGQFRDGMLAQSTRWRSLYDHGVTPGQIARPKLFPLLEKLPLVGAGAIEQQFNTITSDPATLPPELWVYANNGMLTWQPYIASENRYAWFLNPEKLPPTLGNIPFSFATGYNPHDLADYKNPALFWFDPNYGLLTLKTNLRVALADKLLEYGYTAIPMAIISIASAGIADAIALGAGSSMDSFDFLEYADPMLNNDVGVDYGALGDLQDEAFNIPSGTDDPLADMINTESPAYYDDTNAQGIMDSYSSGNNVLGDSATLSDQNMGLKNPTQLMPKGGGATLSHAAQATGGRVTQASPSFIDQVARAFYVPQNPRNAQASALNPQGGGAYPIYNPSGNDGTGRPYGSQSVGSVSPFASAAQLTSGMSPLVIGAAVVLLGIVLLK